MNPAAFRATDHRVKYGSPAPIDRFAFPAAHLTGGWHDRVMRAVVQRVTRARVSVDGADVGAIGPGLCVLVA